MTIEVWNIVLSAAILAVLLLGGIWLKYVVDQQLKSKDTAIEALEGALKLKDAHIASLEGNTAPAIAKAYVDMKNHANLMTEESQELSKKLTETTVELAKVTEEHQFEKELVLPKVIMGEIRGLIMASDYLQENVWNLVIVDGNTLNPSFAQNEFQPLIERLVALNTQINREIRNRLAVGTAQFQELRKELE